MEQQSEHHDDHADRTQRPSEPCGGAAAHPIDSSTLLPCPFCHNTTLQHDRLQSVTTTVTKEKIQCELPRIPIPRTRVNKGQQKRRAKVVTIAFPLPSHTDKTSSDRYQGFGRYPKLSGTYQRPCSARSAPLYGCVYKPIETVVLCVRSSGPSRARSSATRAFKAALRSF